MRARRFYAVAGVLLLCACSGATSSGGTGEGGKPNGGGPAGGNAGASGGVASSGGSASGGAANAGATSGGNASGGGNASAGAANAGAAGSGADDISCTGTTRFFPEFDRTCTSASDCVLVAHTTNCCGAMLILAIAAPEKSAFDEAEAICDAQYPLCGCAAQGAAVEDGSTVSASWQAEVGAACDAGRCEAHSTGAFACGAETCTSQQYCSYSVGGPQGSEPSFSCVATTCSDCACLKPDSGCSCSAPNGHLMVSCQRP